jgi:hypothetical protein
MLDRVWQRKVADLLDKSKAMDVKLKPAFFRCNSVLLGDWFFSLALGQACF